MRQVWFGMGMVKLLDQSKINTCLPGMALPSWVTLPSYLLEIMYNLHSNGSIGPNISTSFTFHRESIPKNNSN